MVVDTCGRDEAMKKKGMVQRMLGYLIQSIALKQFDIISLLLMFLTLSVIAFVVFPARAMAQAFIADKLGDPTAKYNGRLSMNPAVHTDVFGIIALYVIGIGFIKPIPLNPRNFRNPRSGTALTLLAGPLIGLIFGFLGMLAFKISTVFVTTTSTYTLLYLILMEVFAQTNIQLAVLTLLPLPFFDGYQILALYLPARWVYMIEQYGQMISFGVLLLLFSGALSYPIGWLSGLFMDLFNLILRIW